jgi:hypothetical protein
MVSSMASNWRSSQPESVNAAVAAHASVSERVSENVGFMSLLTHQHGLASTRAEPARIDMSTMYRQWT